MGLYQGFTKIYIYICLYIYIYISRHNKIWLCLNMEIKHLSIKIDAGSPKELIVAADSW